MIFDKNTERIKELEKRLLKGKGNPQKIRKRIKELKDRGPEWWVGFYDDSGKKRREKCEKNTYEYAEKLERKRKNSVDEGVYDPPEKKHVKLYIITNFFCTEINTSSDTLSICNKINSHFIGNLYLDDLSKNPMPLIRHFNNFPEKHLSSKSVWNYFIKLRASINMWINIHDLKITNPCKKVLLCCKGLSSAPNRREVTPGIQDYRNTITACIEAGSPQSFIDLNEAVYLSGLRVGEVLSWIVEDFCLDLVRDESGEIIELPYYKTLVEKQGKKVYQENPMSFELWQLMKRVIGDRKTGRIWPWKNPPYHIWERDEIQKLAGTEHLRPYHDNRKSFKKQLKKKGVAKIYTKYLQGQKTNSMDDYYTCYQRLDAQDAFMDGYK